MVHDDRRMGYSYGIKFWGSVFENWLKREYTQMIRVADDLVLEFADYRDSSSLIPRY